MGEQESKLIVDLSDRYQLIAEERCYCLRRRVGNSTNRYTVEGYYSKLEHVLDAIVDKQLRDSEARSMRSLIKILKGIRSDIKLYAEKIESVKDN